MSYTVNAYRHNRRPLGPDGRYADPGPADVREWTETVPDRDSAERRALALVETDQADLTSFWRQGPGMKHVIRWFVVLDGVRMPRQATMRGTWGYDAVCSCGWDSRVGGGTLRYIRSLVREHKWDVKNGFWPEERNPE